MKNMTKSKLQLCTASALGDATKALRSAGDDIKACVTAICEGADGETKTKLNAAMSKMATMLAGLPDPDKAQADAEIAAAWQSIASTSQAIVAEAHSAVKESATKMTAALASIPTETEKAIQAKITS